MARKKADSSADDAGGPKKGKRKLVLIVVGVLLLAGGGFTGLKMFGPQDAAAAEGGKGGKKTEAPVEEGPVIEVATMTASLPGPEPHYAKVGFAAVLAADAATDEVETRFALLKDAAVTEISRSSADKLRTPEGVDDLRRRLSKRAVALYPDGEIIRIVLTELVVQ